jgi:hypothetical protein
LNFNRNLLEILETLDFKKKIGQQAHCYTLLPEKNQFSSKEDEKFEFHSKREIGLIS